MNKIFFSIVFLLFIAFQISFAQEKIIKGGIINGMATYLPKPDYPQKAKDFCVDGVVEVQVLIGEDGNVISAETVSGDELLRDSAVEAAKKAKFRMGHAVIKTKGKLIYNFVSEDKCIDVGIVNSKALSISKPQLENIIHPKHLKLEKSIEVRVQIIIDFVNGEVLRARVLNGHPLLNAPLIQSAIKIKFRPMFVNVGRVFAKGIIVYKIKPNGEVETKIDDELVLGEALSLPKASVPSTFNGKLKSIETILVETLIDENGNVISAKAISGHPVLKAACVAAARNSKFSQTTISGIPIKAKALLTYEYIFADELIVNVIINSIEPQK